MLGYKPIDPGVPSEDIAADDITTVWEPQYFHADFQLVSTDRQVLRISFHTQTIVRILDEMPMSTETDPAEWSGIVTGHFAYTVAGDKFLTQQSEAWLTINGPTHYRFLTDWGCLDVVASQPPIFSVLEKAAQSLPRTVH